MLSNEKCLVSARRWKKSHVANRDALFACALCGVMPFNGWDAAEPIKPVCRVCACVLGQDRLASLKAEKIVADYSAIALSRFIEVANLIGRKYSLEPEAHRIDTLAESFIEVVECGESPHDYFKQLERENGL